MYPILNLRYHRMDLHWYLRALEEVVIRTLCSTFSIKASRTEGLTGVWVGDKKLAAIGIKVSQWVTYHGLALNVTTDLSPFNQIVPCGIQDRQVGTVKGLQSNPVMPIGCEADIDHHTNDSKLIGMACKSLIKEFSEVFQIEMCLKRPNALWQHQGEMQQVIYESALVIYCQPVHHKKKKSLKSDISIASLTVQYSIT
ncbi:hypothetical protein Leryth_014559 [Lithospermum erythrorhizon]|nr:hypothetical protein Leryth_014559 [Lithospermum erythrorhizon]